MRWLALAEHALHPLLQGESFAWLPALRRELQAAGLVALTRAIDAAHSSGDMGLALEAATRRLAVDPTHEETVEVAMRLHLERGSNAAAAACYRSFCAALARRYESVNPDLAQPSGALRALYRSLRTVPLTEDPPHTLSSSLTSDHPAVSVLDTSNAPQQVVPRGGVSSARMTPNSMLHSLAVGRQSASAPRGLYNQRPASQCKHGRRTRGGIPTRFGLLSVAVLLGLAYAVAKMGLVSRNVSEMLKPPKRGHREMMPLSVIEVRRFLDAVQGDRFEALYILALSTGMREGELLGLRWQDVDLARRIVQVRMNVQETSGRYILAETKTAYSRRTVALTQAAVDALAAHWQMQQVEKASMGTGTTMRSTWYSPTASAAS